VYRPLGVGVAGNPGVGSAADGRLEIFVRGSDGHIISILFSMAYPRIFVRPGPTSGFPASTSPVTRSVPDTSERSTDRDRAV
jgi:hypothetical protein